MRILITGICGFVGATLARGLRESASDWEIVGIDNFIRRGSETNREPLRRLGVIVRHGDIRSASDLEALPRCDWIIDAAANPSVLAGVDGKSSSRQLIEHNLAGTLNVLELAKSWRSGIIMLSTSRVYSIAALTGIEVEVKSNRFVPKFASDSLRGLSEQGVAENFSTEPPLSLYGSTKRASELLVLEYGAAFDLPVYINRCGVLAGAGQFGRIDQGIFSFWIHSQAGRRPLKFIGFGGKGFQVRDCLHARDLVPLIKQQIDSPTKTFERVLNISGGSVNSASLRQLNDWCAQRFGNAPIGVEEDTRPFDVPWLILDSGAAERIWGWKPITPLERIWSEIAEHSQQHPNWLERTAD